MEDEEKKIYNENKYCYVTFNSREHKGRRKTHQHQQQQRLHLRIETITIWTFMWNTLMRKQAKENVQIW